MADRAKSAGMTSWSRHDPVHKAGNTDHWTKLKVRNNTYRATDDGAKVVPDHTIDQVESLRHPGSRYRLGADGGVAAVPGQSLTDALLAGLGGKAPGDHDKLARPTQGLQKRWMNNEYQKRAKDNFRYWLINRPPPTSFGKYGIGSYKMVMGLGMAPRT